MAVGEIQRRRAGAADPQLVLRLADGEPGVSFSKMKALIPRVPCAGSVFAKTM